MAKDPHHEALRQAWRQQERQNVAASIPISHQDLHDLFDFLDRPNPPPCDHTLRETIDFLNKRNIEPEKVLPWLREHGGYCDCEVIFNVEEKFGPIVGRS